MTADRRYPGEMVMGILASFGMYSIFVFPVNIVGSHPFVAEYWLEPFRFEEDQNDTAEDDENILLSATDNDSADQNVEDVELAGILQPEPTASSYFCP